jgi:predicted DNA-binding transcriptional regulator AlpA
MQDEASKTFLTDKQLRERWHCSGMKLWRLRDKGVLPRPIKIGGRGTNLTPAAIVMKLEAADASR